MDFSPSRWSCTLSVKSLLENLSSALKTKHRPITHVRDKCFVPRLSCNYCHTIITYLSSLFPVASVTTVTIVISSDDHCLGAVVPAVAVIVVAVHQQQCGMSPVYSICCLHDVTLLRDRKLGHFVEHFRMHGTDSKIASHSSGRIRFLQNIIHSKSTLYSPPKRK